MGETYYLDTPAAGLGSTQAVKQMIRDLKGTQHTCLRIEPRGMVKNGVLELVGRKIGPAILERAKASRDVNAMCRA